MPAWESRGALESKPSRRTLSAGRHEAWTPQLPNAGAGGGLGPCRSCRDNREIAIVLGVRQNLHTWKKNQTSFGLKNGKLKLDVNVKKSLYKLAIGGNVTACIFWLKNRDKEHWRDQQQQEHSGRVEAILRFAYGNGNGHA